MNEANKTISIATYACVIFASGYFAALAVAKQPETKLANNNFILANNNQVILNSSKQKKRDNLIKTLIILGLVSGVGSIGWYLSRSRFSSYSLNFIPGENSNRPLIDRVSPKLRRKLLRLVNDPKTANRLLAGIHKHNRDRSPNWLAEKAIYDLRRGR